MTDEPGEQSGEVPSSTEETAEKTAVETTNAAEQVPAEVAAPEEPSSASETPPTTEAADEAKQLPPSPPPEPTPVRVWSPQNTTAIGAIGFTATTIALLLFVQLRHSDAAVFDPREPSLLAIVSGVVLTVASAFVAKRAKFPAVLGLPVVGLLSLYEGFVLLRDYGFFASLTPRERARLPDISAFADLSDGTRVRRLIGFLTVSLVLYAGLLLLHSSFSYSMKALRRSLPNWHLPMGPLVQATSVFAVLCFLGPHFLHEHHYTRISSVAAGVVLLLTLVGVRRHAQLSEGFARKELHDVAAHLTGRVLVFASLGVFGLVGAHALSPLQVTTILAGLMSGRTDIDAHWNETAPFFFAVTDTISLLLIVLPVMFVQRARVREVFRVEAREFRFSFAAAGAMLLLGWFGSLRIVADVQERYWQARAHFPEDLAPLVSGDFQSDRYWGTPSTDRPVLIVKQSGQLFFYRGTGSLDPERITAERFPSILDQVSRAGELDLVVDRRVRGRDLFFAMQPFSQRSIRMYLVSVRIESVLRLSLSDPSEEMLGAINWRAHRVEFASVPMRSASTMLRMGQDTVRYFAGNQSSPSDQGMSPYCGLPNYRGQRVQVIVAPDRPIEYSLPMPVFACADRFADRVPLRLWIRFDN